jgi:hypothetical protein
MGRERPKRYGVCDSQDMAADEFGRFDSDAVSCGRGGVLMPISEETRMQRRWIRAENKRMRAAGISVPVARKAYRVEISAIEMPEWASAAALQALTHTDKLVWLRARGMAKRLSRMDQVRGGIGTIDMMEYRRCPTCDGLLLGTRATEMREWQRANPGQHKACGPDCREGK